MTLPTENLRALSHYNPAPVLKAQQENPLILREKFFIFLMLKFTFLSTGDIKIEKIDLCK